MKLSIAELLTAYRGGVRAPSDVVAAIYDAVEKDGEPPVWISLVPRVAAMARAYDLESASAHRDLPLFGIPFAVKDNIDVEGMLTTAGCPAYAYTPERSATVVERLLEAGAILIGKTNLDQFATGLVGTRSPYGACASVFDPKYISGGSSSGSAVAVARGYVAFSLGTDTAGSGRVPAAFNGLVGVKPTRGLVSTAGVVPACRSLDCVSIFANDTRDGENVLKIAGGFDERDPYSRQPKAGDGAAAWIASARFRFGVPRAEQLEFFGDTEARLLYQAAIERAIAIGGEKVEFDLQPFRDAAQLLYAGPWVAERLAAIEPFHKDHAAEVDPVVRSILEGGAKYSAVDAHRAAYRLQELRGIAERIWRDIDVMLLPTTGTIYTHKQIASDPVALNSNLGYYTNFVNLLDFAAVAIPAGVRPNGLPFGVTFLGAAFSDTALLALSRRFLGEAAAPAKTAPGCVHVAVVGAHLSGQPLNRELTDRSARLVRTCRTAPGYRLYALANTTPPKPGLVRDPAYKGKGIEVEIWAVPENRFGSFVAGVPEPLGIGSATMDNGEVVKCFICEGSAIAGAREITEFGGWRAFRSSL